MGDKDRDFGIHKYLYFLSVVITVQQKKICQTLSKNDESQKKKNKKNLVYTKSNVSHKSVKTNINFKILLAV